MRNGAALFLLRDLQRAFSEIEGLFTVLICIPCLEVRLAQPDTLLGFQDPGQPWEQWGCRSRAAANGSSAPGTWSGTPRPGIPTGRPPTSCCGRTRTSASESCTAAAIGPQRPDATSPRVVPTHPPRGRQWLQSLDARGAPDLIADRARALFG